MPGMHSTTRRAPMKGDLAATVLPPVGSETCEITRLIAERRRLDDVINNLAPDDFTEEFSRKWLRDLAEVGNRLAETPIRSRTDALEVMRFLDSRLLDGDAVTALDNALIHNVLSFMERNNA